MEREHILKCWPEYFDAIKAGIKPFEVRRDDRGFQRGDILILQRTGNGTLGTRGNVDRDYHGKVRHELRKRITYVLTGGQFGIEPGYVVLGLADLDASRDCAIAEPPCGAGVINNPVDPTQGERG